MKDLFIMYNNVKFKNYFKFDESEALQNIYKNFKSSINSYHASKYRICFYLNQLKEFFDKYEDSINLSFDYERTASHTCICDFMTFCKMFFGFDRSTVQRYLKVYEKFFKGSLHKHCSDFIEKFDISKLVELLVLEDYVIEGDLWCGKLKPIMSFREIRKYVTSKLCGAAQDQDNVEINEEEIPMAYDPSKHYEDKYFMGLAKSQLVNNIITLQEHCEKLQEKIKELKKKKVV